LAQSVEFKDEEFLALLHTGTAGLCRNPAREGVLHLAKEF
jgi:hypothetical protein